MSITRHNSEQIDPTARYSIRNEIGTVVYTAVWGTEARDIVEASPTYSAHPES